LKQSILSFVNSGKPRFYATYEELKPFGTIANLITGLAVFTLPMRNWNTLNEAVIKNFELFLRYLWGIETTQVGAIWEQDLKRFYATYEELKRSMARCRTCRGRSSFYATYEELKHINAVPVRISSTSFYATYEELKLG